MPWIHIDDLTRLFIYAAENSAVQGPLNGCAPHPVRNAEFVRALGRALHRPAILPMPKFALRLALGEVADSVMSSIRAVPAATQQTGFQFEHPELENALTSLLE